ncbi:CocE/NonD family hydrolase C-terminal non-catalytic domain-containing protein [Oceanobacillus sojae]|uniref:CocE/NonD family hydrolase C-terminal non-catalytic domain-containing protein n=1 Tax=Oceanobacillus sojae TaxID=582851 RepID=UPI00362F1C28
MLKKGHRIHLSITSSSQNFIFLNTNTGENPATAVKTVQTTQQVHHQARNLS